MPREVIARAMEGRRKLIAYSCETGASVVDEITHLTAIISGAYLDTGLTVRGKQRRSGLRV